MPCSARPSAPTSSRSPMPASPTSICVWPAPRSSRTSWCPRNSCSSPRCRRRPPTRSARSCCENRNPSSDPPREAMMNPLYQEQLQRITRELTFLPDKPEETPESTLRALWHLAAGRALSAEAAMKVDVPALDASSNTGLLDLVDQRLSGVPLAHLTQRQNFVGMEMLAGPGALVPR